MAWSLGRDEKALGILDAYTEDQPWSVKRRGHRRSGTVCVVPRRARRPEREFGRLAAGAVDWAGMRGEASPFGRGASAGPLVSIVVPVHQGERYLGEALGSIFAQDYRPIQVVVVDDGSTDGGGAVAASFPEVELQSQDRAGVARARNVGVRACRGELVAFLDQDDLWLPRKLRLQVEVLDGDPGLGYVLARAQPFLDAGLDRAPEWLTNRALLEPHAAPLPGTLMVRRSVLDLVGPFDERIHVASDTDWLVRAQDAGVRWRLLPEILLRKRIHADNLSRQQDLIRTETLAIIRASLRRKREAGSGVQRGGLQARRGG